MNHFFSRYIALKNDWEDYYIQLTTCEREKLSAIPAIVYIACHCSDKKNEGLIKNPEDWIEFSSPRFTGATTPKSCLCHNLLEYSN